MNSGGWDLNNRLTALLRKDQKSSPFSPFYEVTVRRQPPASQEVRSSETKSACTLILGIQPLELWEINVYSLRHPVYGVVTAAVDRWRLFGILPVHFCDTFPHCKVFILKYLFIVLAVFLCLFLQHCFHCFCF